MEYKLPKEYKKPADYTSLGYISPIQITIDTETNKIFKAYAKAEEQLIMSTINTIADVDREELIKALQYDRNQYDKGYQDAKAEYDRGHGHWILESEPDGTPYCLHCSVCDDDFRHIGITTGYDYCPLCGAKMDEEVE